jgi:hypothetical protein
MSQVLVKLKGKSATRPVGSSRPIGSIERSDNRSAVFSRERI